MECHTSSFVSFLTLRQIKLPHYFFVFFLAFHPPEQFDRSSFIGIGNNVFVLLTLRPLVCCLCPRSGSVLPHNFCLRRTTPPPPFGRQSLLSGNTSCQWCLFQSPPQFAKPDKLSIEAFKKGTQQNYAIWYCDLMATMHSHCTFHL